MSRSGKISRRSVACTLFAGAAALADIRTPVWASGSPGAERLSFVVILPARLETIATTRAMVFDVVDAMSREPDFVNTWIHEMLDEPNTLVLYETWACTREYFVSYHLQRPYRQAFEASLPRLLASERRIDFLKGIRAYPAKGV